MLNWANQFNIFCLLDNCQYTFSTPAFESLLAVGSKAFIELPAGTAFEQLKAFSNVHKNQWLFGHLGYDLKNEVEQLSSAHADGIGFSDMHFFVPEIVVQLTQTEVHIFCDEDATAIFQTIQTFPITIVPSQPTTAAVQSKLSKAAYLAVIKNLQQHIARGDCYEINFCQEFFSQNASIDPLYIYQQLIQVSPNPFSALYKLNDKFCLCASPERYIKRSGTTVISQPIKGTSKRDHTDAAQDEANKQYLLRSEKEKSENVMIVDLVRNDLSKVCTKGSVKVEELFGVYGFPQVHQMISTISGQVAANTSWVDIIKATFPMGSMTGAPKKRVMELIEQYESTKRGLFSGAIGYVAPNGDLDFNVVIRSMFYNSTTKYLSFQTGSGITFYCDAEKEYEECMLKAQAMLNVLQ